MLSQIMDFLTTLGLPSILVIVLVAVVIFVPSSEPYRRLRGLILALRRLDKKP